MNTTHLDPAPAPATCLKSVYDWSGAARPRSWDTRPPAPGAGAAEDGRGDLRSGGEEEGRGWVWAGLQRRHGD